MSTKAGTKRKHTEEQPAQDTHTEASLSDLKLPELKAICKNEGYAIGGTKTALVDRILSGGAKVEKLASTYEPFPEGGFADDDTLDDPEEEGIIEHATARYANRPSPAYLAKECGGMRVRGKDHHIYESIADKNGRFSWKKA
jgi:hypothetical protein